VPLFAFHNSRISSSQGGSGGKGDRDNSLVLVADAVLDDGDSTDGFACTGVICVSETPSGRSVRSIDDIVLSCCDVNDFVSTASLVANCRIVELLCSLSTRTDWARPRRGTTTRWRTGNERPAAKGRTCVNTLDVNKERIAGVSVLVSVMHSIGSLF
jgi:hypothetical protein